MDVLEYANALIGEEQIARLSAVECYVLIMSCYLHDIGMGINQKNYESMSGQINFGNYFATHSREDDGRIIRKSGPAQLRGAALNCASGKA